MNVNVMIHSRDVNLLLPARSEQNSIIRCFVRNIKRSDDNDAFGLNLKASGKSLEERTHSLLLLKRGMLLKAAFSSLIQCQERQDLQTKLLRYLDEKESR